MELAGLILGMAVVTFVTRYVMIAALARWSVPHGVSRALEYVPVAAFAAIIAPDLFSAVGQAGWVPYNSRLVAGIAAILVALVSRHILLTLVAGMLTLWLVQALTGM